MGFILALLFSGSSSELKFYRVYVKVFVVLEIDPSIRLVLPQLIFGYEFAILTFGNIPPSLDDVLEPPVFEFRCWCNKYSEPILVSPVLRHARDLQPVQDKVKVSIVWIREIFLKDLFPVLRLFRRDIIDLDAIKRLPYLSTSKISLRFVNCLIG